MGFYFIVHVILGLIAGSAIQTNKLNVMEKPLWVSGSYGQLATFFAGFSWLLGCLTTLFKYGFLWSLVTFGEVVLGTIIAVFLPASVNFLLLLLAPIISVVILGAKMGFWYI